MSGTAQNGTAGVELEAASPISREDALGRIAARAQELDRRPRFPSENFADLARAGILQEAARRPGGLASEVALVRAVAAADGSTARILDGHLNGVERLSLNAEEPLRGRELEAIRRGEILLGVWGADPAPGEGPPAQLIRSGDGYRLRGVKTFCSGAGGVQRALVVVLDEQEQRRVAYLDTTGGIVVDREWYRASGLRSSESHRVEFHDAPVLALLGGVGELSREPWFSRDAVRTAATWAGLVDCIVRSTLDAVDPKGADELRAHAVGRITVARATIDRWLEHAILELGETDARPDAGHDGGRVAAQCRVALSDCGREIAALAANACGSRALVGGGPLERARRDLDLFLLQHRLDPKIVALGSQALTEHRR
ncbi:MAG TPA: acyl-CoA dehydrogenase family protein [Solirubrobacteraceae bacterium]|nr:acyl-CoA dehydrogenase family protein [Solirubrobacteraceae bacterium]